MNELAKRIIKEVELLKENDDIVAFGCWFEENHKEIINELNYLSSLVAILDDKK